MRSRRFFVNLSGVLLAFGIAFGGVFGVWSGLERERRELLSSVGEVAISENAQGVQVYGTHLVDVEVEVGVKSSGLSQEELCQAVERMEGKGEKYPHEPVAGQLSMTEAIRCGEAWMRDFFLPGLGRAASGPEEYRMSCYLWAGKEAENSQEPEEALYGYWEVAFSAQEMEAVLFLNAVTGQVLKAWVALPLSAGELPEEESLSGLLRAYADSFGIDTNYVISGTGDGGAGDGASETGSEAGGRGTGPEGYEAGTDGTRISGAGTNGTWPDETETNETGTNDPGDGGVEDLEKARRASWGFRQRLENDRLAVCLEAGSAVPPSKRLVNSGEALCFVLYWETKTLGD